MSLQKIFDDVYATQKWGKNGHGSGSGSEPDFTQPLRTLLLRFIKIHNVKTILDCPCGSGKWVNVFLEELKAHDIQIKYHGIDIAEHAVKTSKALLEHHKDYHEIVIEYGDMTNASMPQGYDLVLCRDALQHLSYINIKAAIKNLAMCDAKWYLIGSYWPGGNKNIRDGEYFSINLALAPFNLLPLKVYSEEHDEREAPKHLFLYKPDILRRLRI
jgi:SAM-dependent methyltransferase